MIKPMTSSARLTAEKIAKEFGNYGYPCPSYVALVDAIESALLAQIKECAKVADDYREEWPGGSVARDIASAIRSLSNRGRG